MLIFQTRGLLSRPIQNCLKILETRLKVLKMYEYEQILKAKTRNCGNKYLNTNMHLDER